MSKHTFEFKKNSIADWIGRDLSVALRGGVKSNSSPKAFIAASAFVTFLAVSPISHAKIENNGQPIFINGIYEDGGYVGVYEKFSDSNASFDINIAQIAESAFFGVNVTNGSTLTMDPIKSLNIRYSDTNTLDKDVNGLQNQLGSTTTIAAQDDVNISIKASTSAEIQGIVNNTGRGVSGDLFSSSLSLSSTNGSINVNVANDDVLAASNIHGLNNGNGGTIRLDAKENINISASVAVSGTYNNLTALTNSGSDSTAILTAGGYISLNSKGNGSSIAIANLMSSNLQLTSQGKNDSGYGMEITSEASGVNSYAIENEGSIYLQALNGGIHLAAAGGTDVTRALYSYNGSVQLIADSD